MSDISPHLLLPYILAALDRDLTLPPASPADGDHFIAASGATGLGAGWDLNVTTWVDGVWMRLVPRPGWLAWIVDETTCAVVDRDDLEAGQRAAGCGGCHLHLGE